MIRPPSIKPLQDRYDCVQTRQLQSVTGEELSALLPKGGTLKVEFEET